MFAPQLAYKQINKPRNFKLINIKLSCHVIKLSHQENIGDLLIADLFICLEFQLLKISVQFSQKFTLFWKDLSMHPLPCSQLSLSSVSPAFTIEFSTENAEISDRISLIWTWWWHCPTWPVLIIWSPPQGQLFLYPHFSAQDIQDWITKQITGIIGPSLLNCDFFYALRSSSEWLSMAVPFGYSNRVIFYEALNFKLSRKAEMWFRLRTAWSGAGRLSISSCIRCLLTAGAAPALRKEYQQKSPYAGIFEWGNNKELNCTTVC